MTFRSKSLSWLLSVSRRPASLVVVIRTANLAPRFFRRTLTSVFSLPFSFPLLRARLSRFPPSIAFSPSSRCWSRSSDSPRAVRARHDTLRILRTHYHAHCREEIQRKYSARPLPNKIIPGKHVLCMIIALFSIVSECFTRVFEYSRFDICFRRSFRCFIEKIRI